MPAQSKAQQAFMAQVHGVLQGTTDVKTASAAVKKAAGSMSKSDAKDFASTPRKGLPAKKESTMRETEIPATISKKVASATRSATGADVDDFDRDGYPGKKHVDVEPSQGEDPMVLISQYSKLGESLKRAQSFREVAEQIGKIAEYANTSVTEANGDKDFFDQHTIKRNMKELSKYAGDFSKISEEMDMLHERATALYDDMGYVLSRYFEMANDNADDSDVTQSPPVEMQPQDHLQEAPRPNIVGSVIIPGRTYQNSAMRAFKWANIRPVGMPSNPKGEQFGFRTSADYSKAQKILHKLHIPMVSEDAAKGTFQDVGLKHQLAIAQKTVRMPDAMANVMGGMTKDEARALLKKHGKKVRESLEEDRTADIYQARRALRTPKAFTRVANNMTREKAIETLKKLGAKNVAEALDTMKQNLERLSESQMYVFEAMEPQMKEKVLRKIVERKQHAKVDGMIIDLYSASAITTVMDSLSPPNKEKFMTMPIDKMAEVAFKLVK